MPWCARCGTGLSQMEMNEGYQDREDPGLTVRLPARRPAGRVAPRLDDDALDARRATSPPRSVRSCATSGSARATSVYWLGRGTPQDRPSSGRSRSLEERPGARPRRAGATTARSTTCRPSATRLRRGRPDGRRTSTGSSPGTEVGEEEGTGIVHIAPGLRRRGLPARQGARPAGHRRRSTRPAAIIDGLRLAEPAASAATSPSRSSSDLQQRGRLLPPRAVRPPLPALLALRHAAALPARRRVVHQHGPGLRPAARGADRRPRSTRSLRYQIMEVVDRIRWIPGFGYERELDWLLQHARLDDQQEALLGPGPADLRLRRRAARSTSSAAATSSASGRSRAGRRSRATRRTGPTWTRSGSPARAAARPSSGSPTSATRGSTPGSCRSRRSTTARIPTTGRSWFPADFITESFPGQFRNWFYSMLAMTHRPAPRAAVQDDLRLRAWSSARTAGRCTRAGATPSSSTRPPSGWASTSCAGCSPAPGPRTTSCSAGTPPTRRGASCSSCGTSTRSSSPTPGWPAGRRATAAPRRRPTRPALDRWILSRLAGARGRGSRTASRDYDADAAARGDRRRFIDDLSTWYLRRSRRRFSRADDARRPGGGLRDAPRRRSSALVRVLAPILPFLAEAIYQNLVGAPRTGGARQRPPDRAGRRPSSPASATSRSRAAMATARRAVELARTLRGAGRASASASRSPGSGWRCPAATLPERDALLDLVARRGQRPGGRADRRRVRARRAPGQAAPAEDRQEARPGDPGGDGRGPGRRVRDPARRLGGAWPGVTLAPDEVEILATPRPGHGGRPRRRARRRHRHRADARAAGRGRRPRAPAGDPGPPPRRGAGARRPDRASWVDAAAAGVVGRTSRPSRPRPWPTPSSTGPSPRRLPRAAVELEAGTVRLACAAVDG